MSLPDCHTVSTAGVVLLQRQESTTIKIKILDGESGKLGVYLSGFMIAFAETENIIEPQQKTCSKTVHFLSFIVSVPMPK